MIYGENLKINPKFSFLLIKSYKCIMIGANAMWDYNLYHMGQGFTCPSKKGDFACLFVCLFVFNDAPTLVGH